MSEARRHGLSRRVTSLGLVGLLALLAAASLLAQTREADLATGIQQVTAGDFETALITLDLAARRLSADPTRGKDLEQAYLYLGVAYLGLGQESLARSKFVQALRLDANLKLSPDEFAPRVIRAFEAARQAATQTAALEKEAQAKPRKKGLIILAIGGAAAAGTAVAIAGTTKERANSPPTASISVSPQGQAIAGVTTMTFTATASDPEGDPLSYNWSFGDGSGSGGSGPTVTHVYSNPGTFSVQLTVGDGLTTTTAQTNVTARPMNGVWRVAGQGFNGVTEFEIPHRGGPSFSFTPRAGGDILESNAPGGIFIDPRAVTLRYNDCRNDPSRGPSPACTYAFRFDGQADPQLQAITGVLACSQFAQPCTCRDQSQSLTLTRQ